MKDTKFYLPLLLVYLFLLSCEPEDLGRLIPDTDPIEKEVFFDDVNIPNVEKIFDLNCYEDDNRSIKNLFAVNDGLYFLDCDLKKLSLVTGIEQWRSDYQYDLEKGMKI